MRIAYCQRGDQRKALMPTITLVKKITDGSPCRKCANVEARLRGRGLWDRIDRMVIADERDPESEGRRLGARYGVAQAPFFIVRPSDGQAIVYTAFLKFLKEVLHVRPSEEEEAKALLENNPDLCF
jgi:hypothetical protein